MMHLLHWNTKFTQLGWYRIVLPLSLAALLVLIFLGHLHIWSIWGKYYNTHLSVKFSWKLNGHDHGHFGLRIDDRRLNMSTSTLLNITDFKFIINPRHACDLHGSDSDTTNLLIVIIPSSRSYFTSRELIRSTWGSVRRYQNWAIRRVFLLGAGTTVPSENSTVQQEIYQEARTHSDIVQGNFQDSYKNMTYKHLMGYKWILEQCSRATFVLKSDDDVMVDIFGVIKGLNGILRHTKGVTVTTAWTTRKYYCAKIYGVGPVRDESSFAGKWHVSVEEYPYDVYPSYCGFAAYLTTVPVLRSIYATAEEQAREGRRIFWIDDVYVTGILRKAYNSQQARLEAPIPVPDGSISIVNTRGRYNWSWEISNATFRQWDRSLRFVVIHREQENGIMDAYWEQIKCTHLQSV